MVEIEEVVELVERVEIEVVEMVEEEEHERMNSKAASIMLPGFDYLLGSTWRVHAYLACYTDAGFQ